MKSLGLNHLLAQHMPGHHPLRPKIQLWQATKDMQSSESGLLDIDRPHVQYLPIIGVKSRTTLSLA